MEDNRKELMKIAVGFALFLLSFVFKDNVFHYILLCAAYAVLGYEVILRAIKNLIHGELFDENMLMTIATVAAIILGNFSEAVFVMFFYDVGEYAQDMASDKSRDRIKDLIDLNPGKVRVGNMEVLPENVEVGTVFTVYPGEKVVIDGVITEGKALLDTKAVTGESIPVAGVEGTEVISGTIVMDSPVLIKSVKKYSDSTLYKIIRLIEESEELQSGTEKFITKFARYYTPSVVAAGLLIAVVPGVITGDMHTWIYRALNFLVISCPCALVLSIPLSFFAGLGNCARNGILVKGAEHLEKLAKTDVVVFDKTGTVTEGKFAVQKIVTFNNTSEDYVMKLAYTLEKTSLHPISSAINNYCRERESMPFEASEKTEIPGFGITGTINGKKVLVGNAKLMSNNKITTAKVTETGTSVFVSEDGKCLGCIVINDTIKSNAEETIRRLKELGIKRTVMLSGDNEESAGQVSAAVGIDEFHANLLPEDKADFIRKMRQQNVCTYCGDGLNDIPVMLAADTSVSMGKIGSDAAVEASSIVFINDDISKLITAKKISEKTMRIAVQNIVLALGVKLACLISASIGFTGLSLAVFADTGVALLAVLNSLRALY